MSPLRQKLAPVLRLIKPSTAPLPTLDDTEILAGLRRGDDSVATAFHARVRPVVAGAVARLLGRHDRDFDDLVQHALIEIMRSLARFRGECSLDGWCARIAARAVWNEIRRRKVERRIFEEPLDAEVPHAEDVHRATESRVSLERIRTHLAAIDPDRAWTFMLHDVCGYDLQEIAEITNVSVAAAQSRLSRGRRELHARLASDPELARDMLDRRSP